MSGMRRIRTAAINPDQHALIALVAEIPVPRTELRGWRSIPNCETLIRGGVLDGGADAALTNGVVNDCRGVRNLLGGEDLD
jgi:hypothetical protein